MNLQSLPRKDTHCAQKHTRHATQARTRTRARTHARTSGAKLMAENQPPHKLATWHLLNLPTTYYK